MNVSAATRQCVEEDEDGSVRTSDRVFIEDYFRGLQAVGPYETG